MPYEAEADVLSHRQYFLTNWFLDICASVFNFERIYKIYLLFYC